MKNLPDKIYLNLNMTPQEVAETKDKDFHEATKILEITWSEERLSKHDPEYIRTDALVEKAVEWLSANAEKYIWYSDYAENIGDDTCGMNDDFIEDFKKYMKRG